MAIQPPIIKKATTASNQTPGQQPIGSGIATTRNHILRHPTVTKPTASQVQPQLQTAEQAASPLVNQNVTRPAAFIAPPAGIIDFQDGEYSDTTGQVLKQDVIVLNVPRQLTARKLYGLLVSNTSNGAENNLITVIKFWLNRSIVGQMDWMIGNSASVLARAYPTILVAGGSATADSLAVVLDAPSTWVPANAILQPHKFIGEMDLITVSVRSQLNTTGIRMYLACASYLQAF